MKRAFRVAMWQVASGRGDVVRRERSLVSSLSTLNPAPTRRGGAALIVVLSLLGTLAFLGLLSYRFANQEFITSQNYALEPTATPTISGIPEFGLRQLIVGTPPSLEDSALYGSNYALVPNMIGRPNADERLSLADGSGTYADVNPYDGLGIGVWADNSGLAAGDFIFDYDGDGVADADHTDFILNFSGAANLSSTAIPGTFPATLATLTDPVAQSFHPDAGYTYPDANSLFLAYDGIVRDPNNPANMYRVIIPSFHRPQYFPSRRLGTTDTFDDIYTAIATQNQVLRPHREHVNASDSSVRRFLNAQTTALSGDTTRLIDPFPFQLDIDSFGGTNEPGVWSTPVAHTTLSDINDPSQTIYEYDVDCDGDGFRDAIWMDLDYPIVTLPDGRQFVPLYAFKVVDMDALLNVNAHGNMNGVATRLWNGDPLDSTAFDLSAVSNRYTSSSDQGLSTSEVNLGLALEATPVSGEQTQHEKNFEGNPGNPTTVQQLSNMELLMLLAGRENYVESPPTVFTVDSRIEGRWGDSDRIAAFYSWIQSGGTLDAPAPGGAAVDDDADSNYVGYHPGYGFTNPVGVYVPYYPMPFVSSDDQELSPVGHAGGGSAYRDPDLLGIWVPPFVHPLDYGGIGSTSSLVTAAIGVPTTRLLEGTSVMSNPMRWPTYALGGTDNVWQSQYTGWNLFDPMGPLPFGGNQAVDHPFINDGSGNYRSLYGVLPYWQSLSASGELHTSNIQHDFLLDDGNETILDRRYRNQEDDAVFPVSEMDALALSETDFSGLGISSTVRDLAIVNLDKGDPNETSQIRKRLTTDSWDRLDFGQGHSVNLTENRAWEFTTWNGGGTFSEFFAGAGTFPPEFSSAVAGSANDPLRPEVRTLLKSEQGYNFFLNPNGNDPRHPRQRLNINRILSDDNAAADVSEPFDMNTAFDSDGNPHFRNLTPHPDLVALNLANTSAWGAGTMTIPNLIHQNTASIPAAAAFSYLGNNIATGSDTDRMNLAIAQEWWARYDRQRLARDIYTLLWILGGGDDATNTTVTAAYYTPEQIQEMAQFAVNYVDALDRDDVITRFEYDNDLTDGWDAAGGSDLQFVTGVEAQQLTISEVLWVQTADTGGDEAPSIWDDNEVREFMYIELRNTSPFEVELRDETFRIARYNPSSTSPDASFVFKTDPANPVIIKPGQTFLIGCHDNSMIVNVSGTDELRASDFYVNPDMGSDFDQIVPYRIDGTDPLDEALPTATSEHPITTLDLDLSYTNSTGSTDHQNRFEFDTAAPFTAPMLNGNTLVSTDAAWSGITTCEIRLQRRKQLRTDGIVDPSADEWGEWVEVDSFENVTQRSFNASGTITDEIDNLISQERAEPFDRENVTDNSTGVGTPSRYHTLGASDFTVDSMDNDDASDDRNQGNSNSPSPFDVWQPHFDRDFSSEFELLSIPLFGPEDVTKKLANGTSQMLSGWYTHPITDGTPGVPSVAMVRFLNPRLDLDNNGTIDYDINNDSLVDTKDENRWYRLFEFLSVPTGGDQAVRERLELVARTPGKININTVRDESVLAAILDDSHIARFSGTNLTDDKVESNRNWYKELTLARDGVDPLNALNSGPLLPLPGVPGVPSDPDAGDIQYGAIPFRSMGYVPPDVTVWSSGQQNNRIAHSLLRKHVIDDPLFENPPGTATRTTGLEELSLFEARSTGDVGTDAVDYHTRNRLLAKLANQTTNRSNVFAVWMTVKYFEAHQPDATNQPNVVQIGAELADSPTLRMFYVVDRTLLEDAVQVDDNGTPSDATDDIMTLNWRSFVVHQRTLPSN